MNFVDSSASRCWRVGAGLFDTAQISYTSFPSHQSQPSSSNPIETEQRRKGKVPTEFDDKLNHLMMSVQSMLNKQSSSTSTDSTR